MSGKEKYVRLILLGANDPEVVRLVCAVQQANPEIRDIAYLDNDVEKHGVNFMGIPVIGGSDRIESLADCNTEFVNLISSTTRVRHETTKKILTSGGRLGQLVHPSVERTFVELLDGVYIQESVVLQAHVKVHRNAAINAMSIVAHESHIGESAFLAPGVCVAGKCWIGVGAYIGTNATILPRLRVGNWATVGAGSVVTRDVPDFAVVAGNPARVIGRNSE